MEFSSPKQIHNRKAVLLCICVCSLLLSLFLALPAGAQQGQGILRFHVVASSNSEADQANKRAVAQALEQALLPLLEQAGTVQTLCTLIEKEQSHLLFIAKSTLSARGCAQDVNIYLQKQEYTDTNEGVIFLKSGEYAALRVVIGEGAGHNCFSALFPSLSLWVASDGTALMPAIDGQAQVGEVKFRTYEIISRFFERN